MPLISVIVDSVEVAKPTSTQYTYLISKTILHKPSIFPNGIGEGTSAREYKSQAMLFQNVHAVSSNYGLGSVVTTNSTRNWHRQ